MIRSVPFLQEAYGVSGDRTGASAVEFSLIAPLIVLGLLGAIDVGQAVNQRIALESTLQAGAAIAMSDPGASAVRNAIAFVDGDKKASAQRGTLTLQVDRYCACIADAETAVACNTTCVGSAPTAIFYRLSGDTTFDGALLPPISIGTENRVRIR
ncbi:TadE family protein [uncultured Roseobacter sp.]|uniref:TadE/TadG family type IV pilus assembly protein n=1 Tax=uncultured Roseobacter sp. TaxID=114847 RepID=UPI002606394C|nr:TadE family protein [uncultured Roseobacter sp.]